MPSSADSIRRLSQLPELEARLNEQGIAISVRDHIRAAQLIEGLRRSGITVASAEDAAGWLTPILARNHETAVQIRATVKRWWRDQETAGAFRNLSGTVQEIAANPVQRRRLLRVLATCAVLAALAAVIWLLGQSTVEEVTQPVEFLPDGSLSTRDDISGGFGRRLLNEIFPTIAILAVFALGIWRVLRTAPATFADRDTAARIRPVDIPLKPVQTSVFVDDESQQALRRLAAPDIIPTRHLDIPRSIRAAISGKNEDDLVFRSRTRQRSYVMVVEANTGEDHIHLVADALLEQARMANLDMPRYELRSHLSFLRYVDGGRHEAKSDTLGTIARRHMGARLLFLGSGEGLFADNGRLLTDLDGARPKGEGTTMFGYFERPCLLSTTPRHLMGAREAQLQRAGIEVAPMSPEGLERVSVAMTADEALHEHRAPLVIPERDPPLFAWLRRARVDLLSDIPPRDDEIEELRMELRSYFRPSGDWPIFMALMLMPTAITRKLTLSLLHYLELEAKAPRIRNADKDGAPVVVRLPRGYSRLKTLARLARLPWFQAGYAPDWLRSTVIRHSDPQEVALMRNVLQRLLEDEGHLPRSRGGENPALDEDEWVLSLFEADIRGSRVASDREVPLIKMMRGDEITELAQPINLHPRPRIPRILAVAALGLAAIATVFLGGPELLRMGAVLILAPYGAWLEELIFPFEIGMIALVVAAGVALSLGALDSYAAPEDAGRVWLARLLSPSRAFLAFARAHRDAFVDGYRRGESETFVIEIGGLRRRLVQEWIDRNGRQFTGFLRRPPSESEFEYSEATREGNTDAARRLYDRLLAAWTRQADQADRVLGWVGRALDALAIFVMGNMLILMLYRLGGGFEKVEVYRSLVTCIWILLAIMLRAMRHFGWRAEPLTAWRTEIRNLTHHDSFPTVLRLVPMFILVSAMMVWAKGNAFDPDTSTDERIIYFWFAFTAIATLTLQTARTPSAQNGVWQDISMVSRDFLVCAVALGVTYLVFVISVPYDDPIALMFFPGAYLLLQGQGHRFHGALILVLPIVDSVLFNERLNDLWPVLTSWPDPARIAVWTLMLCGIVGLICSLRIPTLLTVERSPDDRPKAGN